MSTVTVDMSGHPSCPPSRPPPIDHLALSQMSTPFYAHGPSTRVNVSDIFGQSAMHFPSQRINPDVVMYPPRDSYDPSYMEPSTSQSQQSPQRRRRKRSTKTDDGRQNSSHRYRDGDRITRPADDTTTDPRSRGRDQFIPTNNNDNFTIDKFRSDSNSCVIGPDYVPNNMLLRHVTESSVTAPPTVSTMRHHVMTETSYNDMHDPTSAYKQAIINDMINHVMDHRDALVANDGNERRDYTMQTEFRASEGGRMLRNKMARRVVEKYI